MFNKKNDAVRGQQHPNPTSISDNGIVRLVITMVIPSSSPPPPKIRHSCPKSLISQRKKLKTVDIIPRQQKRLRPKKSLASNRLSSSRVPVLSLLSLLLVRDLIVLPNIDAAFHCITTNRVATRSKFGSNKRLFFGRPTNPPLSSSSSSSSGSSSSPTPFLPILPQQSSCPRDGLSKIHLGILNRISERQRFVTGKSPVIVTITENPTIKWLSKTSAISQLLINGTSVSRSLASMDRFQWLDDEERVDLQTKYSMISIELLAEINVVKPGYVNVLPNHGAGSTAEQFRVTTSDQTNTDQYFWNTKYWNNLVKETTTATDNNNNEDTTSPAAATPTIASTKAASALLGNAATTTAPQKNAYTSFDRVWVTGFSITGRKGYIYSIDTNSGHIESVRPRTEKAILWPNEATYVPNQLCSTHRETRSKKKDHDDRNRNGFLDDNYDAYNTNMQQDDALLVCDGFLVPGKDRGGLYVVKDPGHPHSEWTVCLTATNRWFYHRAVWIDLTGDGRKSILTARAKLNTVLSSSNPSTAGTDSSSSSTNNNNNDNKKKGYGELVWLEMPKPYKIDKATGTPLEKDGTVFNPFSARHLPWKTRVLAEGPDVMFSVADLDTNDDTIEVISTEFFGEKITVHSIQKGPNPKVIFQRIIDDNCGAAFGCILAALDGNPQNSNKEEEEKTRVVIDAGSTVMTLKPGDSFSHLLVTSHECSYGTDDDNTDYVPRRRDYGRRVTRNRSKADKVAAQTQTQIQQSDAQQQQTQNENTAAPGGSLFAYKVPRNWKTDEWIRTTVASGFRVEGQLGNMINPGAPGFVYTFHAKKGDEMIPGKRPMIAVAGDCAEAAYLFRPDDTHLSILSPETSSSKDSNNKKEDEPINIDANAQYKLMCEIKCGATVGSIGIGYENFCSEDQESDFAKLYIPCYEKDRILVFSLGSGKDATIEGMKDYDDGW